MSFSGALLIRLLTLLITGLLIPATLVLAAPTKAPKKKAVAPTKRVAVVPARTIAEPIFASSSREERERMAQDVEALISAGKTESDQEAQKRYVVMAIRAARAMERAESRDDEVEFGEWRQLLKEKFAAARDGIRQQAESGNGVAAYAFGVYSLNGIGAPPNLDAACANFAIALAKGFGGARFRHAQCIEEGQSDRAAQLMIEAADVGHVAANERLGRQCLEAIPPDRACAIRRLERAAVEGRAGARALLAWMYVNGVGGEPDLATGARMYADAAAAGDLSALNNYAGMLEHGMGVAKDEKAAVERFRQGAEQGYPPAQFNLGRMYAAGRGVISNTEEAKRWLKEAASGGVEQALELLRALEAETKATEPTAKTATSTESR